MTPTFADLVGTFVTDDDSRTAAIRWLEDTAVDAGTHVTAGFLVTLRAELEEPSPVGSVSPRFLRLAAIVEDHDRDAIRALATGGHPYEWLTNLLCAGAYELDAGHLAFLETTVGFARELDAWDGDVAGAT